MLIELIPAALHEQRLDRVVSLISDISRASTATLISVGGVQVDGVIATAGKVKVREGQQVVIDTSLFPEWWCTQVRATLPEQWSTARLHFSPKWPLWVTR